MTLYLQAATYIDWQTLAFRTGHLAVAPGLTGGIDWVDVLPAADALSPEDRVLDCRNRLVTHGFACGHHHIYSALARGMPAPPKTPHNFVEILENIWWRVDKALDLEMIEASALVSALYCLKNGVTFIIDHHASPFAIEGCLETVARAFDKAGLSHLLCYEMSDRDGDAKRAQGLAESEAYLQSGRQGHVGLHASFTVGNELLQRAVALARRYDTGLHVHVAEDAADQKTCLQRHGQRVVERYQAAGALDSSKTILAHCIHLDDAETAILQQAPVWIAQSVESNQNNNVGLGDYRPLSDRVMLGTDGMHSDMLRSAKAAFLAGQAVEGIDMAGIYRRFRKANKYLRSNGFAGDGANNLVILNYNSPTEVTAANFLGHFVYGLDAAHVESVIANGKLVVAKKKLLTMDEAEILVFAREMGRRLWDKLNG